MLRMCHPRNWETLRHFSHLKPLKVRLRLWYVMLCLCQCSIVHCSANGNSVTYSVSEQYHSATSGHTQLTQLQGGRVAKGTILLTKEQSPYILREDLIIESSAELVIEPDVEVKFSPMVGLTVRGIVIMKGNAQSPIVLTSSVEPEIKWDLPSVRLVDGPSIVVGRLQVLHNGRWRSVCTNSRNWTRADIDVVCRHLGFQGGEWWNWLDRIPGQDPRLLLEEPKCKGTESTLYECDWDTRQMGSGVCDYHPDIAIQCLPKHVSSLHWRGILFDNAKSQRVIIHHNTYVEKSLSELVNVEIRFAGSGRDYAAVSAVQVIGPPPQMINTAVLFSAFNGMNVSMPNAPTILNNCTLKSNRGYGIYINSSSGLAHIDSCKVIGNGADGVKYVHHDELLEERLNRKDVYDFCTIPTTGRQSYPLFLMVEQEKIKRYEKECSQYFFTQDDQVITIHFISINADQNDTGVIEIYDGISINEPLLAKINFRNGTKPQSIKSSRSSVFIRFLGRPQVQLFGYFKIMSSYHKYYDLNVTSSSVTDNNGRGVTVENIRSLLHVHRSSISNNHIAGISVIRGAGDVNVSESRIAFNNGDGINITYTGGNRNITKTSVSSNKGFGIAVWFNESIHDTYLPLNQSTIVSYSEVFKNNEIGVFVGNFCQNSIVNITGNWFNDSLRTNVEILSCWKPSAGVLQLQIGHNTFKHNSKLGIKLQPALNLNGKFEYNKFMDHLHGCILVKNGLLEEFETLPVNLIVENNYFESNYGVYVVNLGLSPYSEVQSLLFTKNFVKDNHIHEPFNTEDRGSQNLIPRSRVAAPIVVSSSNIDIFRNIIQNPESSYEIGSHLEDQSKVVNCTYNWLGFSTEQELYSRIFDRKDRYNLAKIVFLPFLLHSSNPSATVIISQPTYVPQFNKPGTNKVGGEVDGIESLKPGEYIVHQDINIRPGGRLILQPGVTLKFPSSVGMMVAGYIEARGSGRNDIRLTLFDERVKIADHTENDTTEVLPIERQVSVRLVGGRMSSEGRLQVRIGHIWGTVCNYGWTLRDAALACHQLGLVLNPDDWYLERSEMPASGTAESIILSNVRCTDDDIDITKCQAEHLNEFENSCTHENDVGLRCYESSWAGVRLGVLAERSDLQYITIEKAGLLDYATNTFKPALQIDFARHALESIRVIDNLQDGLGVLYSDLFSRDIANTVKNSEFSNNRGCGISFKQLGLKISGSKIENNKRAGIRHNPALSAQQQREIAGWFTPSQDSVDVQDAPYKPIFIPQHFTRFDVDDKTLYVVTSRVKGDNIERNFYVTCQPGYVIGIQLLNPIYNRSTEEIIVYDSLSINSMSRHWNLSHDLVVFPVLSSTYGIVIVYRSGFDALGGTVIVLSSYPDPVQNAKNMQLHSHVPTLTLSNTVIKGNKFGLWASYFNRYLNQHGDHFLRKANETIQILDCHISHNTEEAFLVKSQFWDIYHSNLSEITFVINRTNILENGKGIRQFSRDLRSSNNLYHWILQDNTIELNKGGGFDVSLPYVWQYNENFTHTLFFDNNTWRSNEQFSFIVDGHFAKLNMSNNIFVENNCKNGLISVRGMEKQMKIMRNRIEKNIGKHMVEFTANSQSEILGEVDARFQLNEVKKNRDGTALFRKFNQVSGIPSYVLGFQGIQKVNVNRNLFGNNSMLYELVAGIRTAKIDNYVNVEENWWGTNDVTIIKKRLFDFDDWNNHALAKFRPYLMEDAFDSSLSVSHEHPLPMDLNYLGGRIRDNLILYSRDKPYIVSSDITVMPGVTLTIGPSVIMEFAPNVGVLVLGAMKAQGSPGNEIIMRPLSPKSNIEATMPFVSSTLQSSDSIRLCMGINCTHSSNMELDSPIISEGFLEYFNSTTMQWVPICDDRFTERNAQVVCRELGFDYINVYFDHGERVEFHSNSLSRIWSWPDPWQCKGDEIRLDECGIRLNGQLYGHHHVCSWDSKFVFIHCGQRNLDPHQDYWGGLRFTDGEFEQNLYEHRIHDVVTHQTARRPESTLEYINISGAGILHGEKYPAIQSINRSPTILRVNITNSASHGINIISPIDTTRLLYNSIEHTLGVGISAVSLTGEGRESEESSFTPLKQVHIPYHLFSLLDMCDPAKEITIEERVLVYYKYDNYPVNCVKIFNSVYYSKPLGFRLLQFNLFNSSGKVGPADSITLYDGDIYNITSKVIGYINVGNNHEKKLYKSTLPSLSIKFFANGASEMHGFIAEVVTLPISAIGFNRDVQHNISFSILAHNRQGAINYGSAGEVNPMITIEWNQIVSNCDKLYGNFTTCTAAINMDIQNTHTVYFRNNLVKRNQGGLSIRADSRGSATSLKGWLHNNLFTDNSNNPALYIEGRQSSPYQEVTIYRNYFTRNTAPYKDLIVLKQVVSNFTYNFVHNNVGHHILEVSGFEKVRLHIYQTTSHNGFYWNFAVDRDSRSTIVAGTAGQHYVDNVFYDPENDYEIVTVNRTFSVDVWKTPIDAKHNWWGYNETLAVMGRIRDRSDHPDLLELDFKPFHMNNQSILSGGKCPPGWVLVGDTCYIYIGAPMSFEDARTFCLSINASMPYVMSNYLQLYHFLRQQQETYQFYDHVWVQHIDKINKCTMFAFQKIEIDNCQRLNPFLCEIDPKVHIDPLSWRDDILTVVVLVMVGIAVLLITVAAGFWYTKSRHRHVERLERRNSIRQSLRSVRSIGLASSHCHLSDIAHGQKASASQRTSPTITKGIDYKKMMNGSIDSMDKSQFNSSVDDTHSFDIYEAHNSNTSAQTFNFSRAYSQMNEAVNPGFDLTYKNEGFQDRTTYIPHNNWMHSTTVSDFGEDCPEVNDNNSSTLPLDASLTATDSTLEMKRAIEYDNNSDFRAATLGSNYPPPPVPVDDETYLLAPSLPSTYDLPSKCNILNTGMSNKSIFGQHSHALLETNLDEEPPPPPSRSKSEVLLETNLDLYAPAHPNSNFNRSKSQPLETAM